MNYSRIYSEFISDRRRIEPELKKSGAYSEKHHIVPRSLGGGDESENIIRLTSEDHIFAHLLLARWHESREMWAAIKFIFGQAKKSKRIPTRREIRIAADAREQFAKRNSGTNNCNYGVPVSPEKKALLRVANLGRVAPDAQKLRISESLIGNSRAKGFKHSEETRQKISTANTGRHHTDQTKAKIAASHTGKKHTDSHRQALSLAKLGMSADHLHTPEARAKRGLALRGRFVSEETRLKQSLVRTGKRHREESKLKMSETRSGAGNGRAKSVTCLSTGEVFGCVKDAAIRFGIAPSTLRATLNKGQGEGQAGGLNFKVM